MLASIPKQQLNIFVISPIVKMNLINALNFSTVIIFNDKFDFNYTEMFENW